MSTSRSTSPRTRGWTDLVSEGRALAAALSQNKWKLGDLALEVVAIGERGGVPTGVEEALRYFADRIEAPYNTLREYRSVASAWPNDRRLASVPWSVYQVLRGQDDRFELIASRPRWTVREAKDLVARRRPPRPSRDVRIPDEGTDASYSVRWSSVVPVLEEHLAGRPALLMALRSALRDVFNEKKAA